MCTHACSSGSSSDCPDGMSCFAYTTCAEPTVQLDVPEPEETMTSFSSEIPIESYYCGSSYEVASDTCATPCPSRDSADCPGTQQCFAYTPCAKPESFFCGSSKDDANEVCAIPCPSGRSNTCPLGESCYAYTECEAPITSKPTAGPTNLPTSNVSFAIIITFSLPFSYYHQLMFGLLIPPLTVPSFTANNVANESTNHIQANKLSYKLANQESNAISNHVAHQESNTVSHAIADENSYKVPNEVPYKPPYKISNCSRCI